MRGTHFGWVAMDCPSKLAQDKLELSGAPAIKAELTSSTKNAAQ